MKRALDIAREQRDEARTELAHVRADRDRLIELMFHEEVTDGRLDADSD